MTGESGGLGDGVGGVGGSEGHHLVKGNLQIRVITFNKVIT